MRSCPPSRLRSCRGASPSPTASRALTPPRGLRTSTCAFLARVTRATASPRRWRSRFGVTSTRSPTWSESTATWMCPPTAPSRAWWTPMWTPTWTCLTFTSRSTWFPPRRSSASTLSACCSRTTQRASAPRLATGCCATCSASTRPWSWSASWPWLGTPRPRASGVRIAATSPASSWRRRRRRPRSSTRRASASQRPSLAR